MANRKITYEVGFTGDTSQLQAALKQAVASLQELGTNPQNLQRGLEGAAHAALELNNHLRNAYNADTGKLDLTRFRQELEKGDKKLEDYAAELRRLGPAGEQAFMQVATAIGAAELPLKRSNQLLNQLWITMKNTMRWRLTTGALNSFIGGLQQAFGYSKSLNASLNDIRIVTGKSSDEMARFAKEANQAAKELSTTTTAYTDASLIYYQQGLDSEAVKQRTDATIKMANVTGQSAETISSQMTAVWNNFREGSRTLESYADTMVALGATTASSSKEIAEGLEKFAPIANSVGLSFDYASAALATLVATTRESASVAGNALKTSFSRLEGLKLGETLEDGTDLNKYSQALYTVGINIKDTNGELKDMDLILSELGNRWKDLARDEQMALAQTVGGVRQYAQLVALMDNWQTFQQNLVTARTAEGSLEKQAQIYAESWEASRDRVKAAAEDVYDSLINPKVFIDLDKMSQAVLKPLASILDGIGGLTGLLPIAAALMTKVYSAQIANVMRDMAVNIGLMTGKEQERARAIQAQSAALAERLTLTYQDDSTAGQRVAVLQQWNSLQSEINSKSDSYTESQMEQAKNAQYMIGLIRDQSIALLDAKDKAEQLYDSVKNESVLSLGLPDSDYTNFFSHFIKLSSQAQQSLSSNFSSVKEWMGDLDKVFKDVNDELEVVVGRSVKINILKNSISEVNEQTEEWKIQIKELAVSLGLMAENEDITDSVINRLKNDLAGSHPVIQQTENDLTELKALLAELFGGGQRGERLANTLIGALERLLNASNAANTSVKHLTKSVEDFRNNPIPDITDWADTFVAIANGASRAAMAIRSFENVLEVLQDDTLSKSEKFIRVLTSLGMILPSIIPMVGLLGKSALKAGTDVATGATVAGTGIAAGVTAAKAAMPIAMALTAVVYVIVKAIDAFNNRQKNAQEEIKKSLDSLNEAKQELESLSDELETTQKRIKELQDLAESGSISIVEQEELRDLQIENDRLERQLELKKELARIEFRNTLAEYQKSGNIAYAVPENTSQSKNYDDIWKALPVFGQTQLSFDEKQGLVNFLASGASLEDAKGYLSAAGLNNYYKTLVAVYDDIEAIREKYDAEWLNNVGDSLSQAETLYESFLDNLEDVSSFDLRNLQQQLRDLRKAFYGDNYGEKVIDPLLSGIAQEDLNKLKGIYETHGAVPSLFQGISQATKDLLIQYGVAAEEAGERVLAVTNKARDTLRQFGLESMADNFSYIELNLIANADEEFTNFEQLLNYIKANAGIIPVSIQIQAIEDARTEALERLASGEMLDEELIAKLQEAYKGIADLADFSSRSVVDQIKFLTTEGKVAETKLDDLKKQKEALETDLKTVEKAFQQAKSKLEIGKGQKLYTAKISLEADLQDVTTEIEKLKEQMEKDPWQIQIEMSNEVAAQINNVKKAIALINEDLSVSAENVVELGKRYPEALVDATYDSSNNILKIEEEKYNALTKMVAESVKDNLDYKRDEAAGWLTAQANVAAGIIAIVNETQGEEREQDKETLKAKLKADGKSLESAQTLATKSLLAVVKSEIQQRQERLNSQLETEQNAKIAADTLGRNAEITTENYSTAAQKILESFDDMFRQIAIGAAIITDPTKQYIPITKNVWRSFKATPGETIDSAREEYLNSLKQDKDYQKTNTELKYLKRLETAIEMFQNGEISWDTVSGMFSAMTTAGPIGKNIKLTEEFAKLIEFDYDPSDRENFNVDEFVEALIGFAGKDSNALGELQRILDETLNSLQYLLEEPEEITADKTGNPKEEKIKKPRLDQTKLEKAELEAEEQTLADIEDRYHEITREIERQGRILSALDEQIERTYGLDRLELYEQKIEELNQLQQDQITKSNRASRYLKETDRPRLDTALKATSYDENLNKVLEKHGIKFAGSSDISLSINPNTREIQDFEKLEQDIVNDSQQFMSVYHEFMVDYNEFLEDYNKFNEAYEDMTDDQFAALSDEEKRMLLTQAEKYRVAAEERQAEYELIQSQYELMDAQQKERLEAISQYESTLDTINTLAHEIEDTARQIEDSKLAIINYRMEVILDVRDARKQIRDFSKEIAQSFGDALAHGAKTASLGWDQARDEMAMYKEYLRQYNELKELLDTATTETDRTAIVSSLKNLEGNIIESGQRLLEWTQQVEDMFVDALSAAADRFSYFTTQLEHNDAILSTIKELYALQGQTYKTQQGFDRLQRVAQERLETQVAQAKLQRKWFEEADARLQEAEAQFNALLAEKGAEAEQDIRYDTLKKNRDALLKEQQEAQKEMLNYAQQAMETAQQMYLDQIEKASYEFGKALSDDIGLDLLQDKYDHYIEEEERYLDKVNEAYQVAAWYDKLQKDIDNTTNKLTKDRLKALQQEIDIRREGNTLSKYDLDILEAKYKVLQAQADLEDAQNAKTQLRLVRDSQGNWNYQFTTNPDDIAAKEQELLQAENEWYNIAKEQTKEVTGEIIAVWQECQQAINDIYSDTSNFIMNEETGKLELTKEAQEKETEIRRFYAEKIKFLEEEKQIAIGDMTEAGNQAMIHMAIAAGETVEDITGITGKEVESLVETTGMSSQQLLQLSLSQIEDILKNRLAELAENLGMSADDLKDMLQRKENGIESDADSTFRAILENADPATVDLYNLFAENWNLIGSLVGETSSGIKGNITDTYTKIQSGLNDTRTAMNLFDNIFAKDLTSMTKNTAIFEVEFDRAVENMQNSFDNYGETIIDVADDCGVSLEALDESVNMVSDSTDRMLLEGLDAAQALWDQVDATWDAQQGYLELAHAVWEYIYALQALAAEQVVPTITEASGVDTFDEDNLYKEYDPNTDWSIEMHKMAQQGDFVGMNLYGEYRDKKLSEGGFTGAVVSTEDLKNNLIEAYKEGNDNLKLALEEVLDPEKHKYYRDVIPIASAATGMYTGDFDNGRLAILHEKELVLNAEDTKNILDAVTMVRTMQDNLFGNIAEQLDNDGFAAMAILGQRMSGIGLPAPANSELDQHVTIEHVSFPGVTSSREIEEAFESLVNDAAQWARRRKS